MKRVLVVDDDDNLREILSAILSKGDRAVDTARDGIAALELISQNQYDVVLSDLRMPGLDGPALYEALRTMQQRSAARVIFMTGNADIADYATFLRSNTEPILEKPFNMDVVRHIVSVLLGEEK